MQAQRPRITAPARPRGRAAASRKGAPRTALLAFDARGTEILGAAGPWPLDGLSYRVGIVPDVEFVAAMTARASSSLALSTPIVECLRGGGFSLPKPLQ